MRKQSGRQRHSRLGAKSSRIPFTTDGGQVMTSFNPSAGDDHAFWRACFIGALRGSTAAQRKLPSPKLLAHWAGLVADCGLDEDRNRRVQEMKAAAKAIAVILVVALASACGSDKGSPTGPTPTPQQSKIIGLEADLAFGDVEVGKSLDRQLHVINSGTAPLTISGMTGPEGYSASPTSGVVQPGQFLNVTVRFSPTDARTYNGTLTVNGDQTSGVKYEDHQRSRSGSTVQALWDRCERL